LVFFFHLSEKGAKNSYGSYPTEFVLRSKMKSGPDGEVSNLKASLKNRTDKIHWDSHEISADGRATEFLFRKNRFFFDKKS
jgi:hypothetical protein